jgi:hypothetical protein
MPELTRFELAKIRLTPDPCTFQTFDPTAGELVIGIGPVLEKEVIVDVPVATTAEEDETFAIVQLVGLIRARWGERFGATQAHRLLVASCPCTPDRIAKMNPRTNPWCRIYEQACAIAEARGRILRRRENKVASGNPAKVAFAKPTKIAPPGALRKR